ncbi:hypothetical protein [Sphingobacterium paramultivorum]|uniref:hypothetical protein n=1 Tax=Sphingobacterium paramultivorum TaxID=2886510 RepID=UPI00129CFC5F|nr:hypothetical protein [Sphingobacterium paramultivorum]
MTKIDLKSSVFVLLFFVCSNGCLGQKLNTRGELLKVLSLDKKDKVISFNNSNKEYGKVFDYLKYLGTLVSSDAASYKVITLTTIWGNNHHTINYLYIYSSDNDFVGKYKYLLKDELPIKIEDNKLVYFQRDEYGQLDRRAYAYVTFLEGPPKIICPGCDSLDDGNGSEIIKEE